MKKELLEYLIRMTVDSDAGKKGAASLVAEMGAMTAGAGAAIGGLSALGYAAVKLGNDMTGTVDQLNTLAMASGLSIETVNGLRTAASATGKDIAQLVPPDLAKRISDTARGTGEAAVGFRELGLEGRILSGELASSDDVLRATIDALSRIEDPTKRADAAFRALGPAGQQMLSAFSDVGDLEAFVAIAGQYAKVGPDAIESTAKWQRSMAAFNLAIDSTKASMWPLIDIVSNTILGFGAMAVGISAAATTFVELVTTVRGALNPLGALATALGAGKGAITQYGSALATMNAELATTAVRFDAAKDKYQQFSGMLGTGGNLTPAQRKAIQDEAAAEAKAKREAANKAAEQGAIEAQKQARAQQMRDALYAIGGSGEVVHQVKAKLDVQMPQLEAAMNDLVKGLEEAVIAEEEAANVRAAEQEAAAAANTRATVEGQAQAAAAFGGAMLSAIGGIAEPLTALLSIPRALSGMMDGLTATIADLPDAILSVPNAVTGLIDAIGLLPSALIAALPEILLAWGNAFISVVFSPIEIYAALIDLLPGRIAQAIADAMRDIMGELNPFDGDGAFLGTDLAADKGEKTLLGIKIPSFDTGGEVGRTGLAYVHEGERMLSVEERSTGAAQRSRGGSMNVSIVSNDPREVVATIGRAIGGYGMGASILGAY